MIGTLFKLYPWEDMLRDDFARNLAASGTRFIEPPWKAVVSNKARTWSGWATSAWIAMAVWPAARRTATVFSASWVLLA